MSALAQQFGAMVLGLHHTVQKRGRRVPLLTGYGNGITIERIRFEIDREALTVDYAMHPEEEHGEAQLDGVDELHAIREARRLTRAVECDLPSADGWDVQVSGCHRGCLLGAYTGSVSSRRKPPARRSRSCPGMRPRCAARPRRCLRHLHHPRTSRWTR